MRILFERSRPGMAHDHCSVLFPNEDFILWYVGEQTKEKVKEKTCSVPGFSADGIQARFCHTSACERMLHNAETDFADIG
jgi:hypothetical protein